MLFTKMNDVIQSSSRNNVTLCIIMIFEKCKLTSLSLFFDIVIKREGHSCRDVEKS